MKLVQRRKDTLLHFARVEGVFVRRPKGKGRLGKWARRGTRCGHCCVCLGSCI